MGFSAIPAGGALAWVALDPAEACRGFDTLFGSYACGFLVDVSVAMTLNGNGSADTWLRAYRPSIPNLLLSRLRTGLAAGSMFHL